jgi:hypothetical protein
VPYGVAVGPANNTLIVSCSGTNQALVYDIGNIAGGTPDAPVLLETVALGRVPDEVAIATVGGIGLAFISNESDNTVTVLDPPGPKTSTPVKLPKPPRHHKPPKPRRQPPKLHRLIVAQSLIDPLLAPIHGHTVG